MINDVGCRRAAARKSMFSVRLQPAALGLVHNVDGYDASLGVHFPGIVDQRAALPAQRAGFDDEVGAFQR
jgi:hypothetical protein